MWHVHGWDMKPIRVHDWATHIMPTVMWPNYQKDVLGYTTKIFANATWRDATSIPIPGRSLLKTKLCGNSKVLMRSKARRVCHACFCWGQSGQEESWSSKQRRHFDRITRYIWFHVPGLQEIMQIEDWSLQPYTWMFLNQLQALLPSARLKDANEIKNVLLERRWVPCPWCDPLGGAALIATF